MKIVVNACFGGFGLSRDAIEILGEEYDDWRGESYRTDEKLIALIEEKGEEFVSGTYAELEIVEIPDTATDWEISEYDGCETVIYVVDGKIHHA